MCFADLRPCRSERPARQVFKASKTRQDGLIRWSWAAKVAQNGPPDPPKWTKMVAKMVRKAEIGQHSPPSRQNYEKKCHILTEFR